MENNPFNLPFSQDDERLQKYNLLLWDLVNRPEETNIYVPFQDHPNLPGFKINTIEIDGRTLYHGLSSQSVKGLQCIPIFTDLKDIKPSYSKYFEMISLPISEVVGLISKDSTAQGLMLDMFTLNEILDEEWVNGIKEHIGKGDKSA